jgi:hypothetical protein
MPLQLTDNIQDDDLETGLPSDSLIQNSEEAFGVEPLQMDDEPGSINYHETQMDEDSPAQNSFFQKFKKIFVLLVIVALILMLIVTLILVIRPYLK